MRSFGHKRHLMPTTGMQSAYQLQRISIVRTSQGRLAPLVRAEGQSAGRPVIEVETEPLGMREASALDLQSQDEFEAEKQKVIDLDLMAKEVDRRRCFCIIAHPDAGKTTLTEKLLLYGGAIQEAGSVKARRASKSATSDFLEIEKQRGISISSTALSFPYKTFQLNLLDTPGHSDFGEDTYRTLSASDNAVLLVDGAKGIEPQTRKLFEVAKLKNLPLFTFVNKMDRPALEPLEIIDQLEKEFKLQCYPVNWPIGSGDRFVGVVHRPTMEVHLFEKTGAEGRNKGAKFSVYKWGDPQLESLIEADLFAQVSEEIELMELMGEYDGEKVARGEMTPMFFGSAMSNFGVELFLQTFVDMASKPGAMKDKAGQPVDPVSERFSGLVFKLQANLDPRHRDRVAFVRVYSGKFEKGMKCKVQRTGKVITLSRPQKLFAQERETVEEGFAGDIIGLNNPGSFAIGDTVYFNGPEVCFPPIPTFSPELFAYIRAPSGQRKAFQKALEGLLGEGAVQVLYSMDEFQVDPILAAVGELQFEVVLYRMKAEYGVDAKLERLPYGVARWVHDGWAAVERCDGGKFYSAMPVKDVYGRPVLLFRNAFGMQQFQGEYHDKIGALMPYALPPETKSEGKR